MTDSERAITTAARVKRVLRDDNTYARARLRVYRSSAFDDVLDAAVPLVVREEHDRLRQEVRRWKPIRVTVEHGEAVYDVHPDGEYLIRSDVLALLGESSQEQTSE